MSHPASLFRGTAKGFWGFRNTLQGSAEGPGAPRPPRHGAAVWTHTLPKHVTRTAHRTETPAVSTVAHLNFTRYGG